MSESLLFYSTAQNGDKNLHTLRHSRAKYEDMHMYPCHAFVLFPVCQGSIGPGSYGYHPSGLKLEVRAALSALKNKLLAEQKEEVRRMEKCGLWSERNRVGRNRGKQWACGGREVRIGMCK